MNRLPLHRADELIRCFDAGMGIRATARATATARHTVRRYHRLWRRGAEADGALVCRLAPPIAVRLSTIATGRREPTSLLAARILEEVVAQDLVAVILA